MDDSIYDPVVPGCMLLQYDSENEEMQSNAGTPMGSTGCLLFLPELDTLVMLTCSRIVDPTGKAVQSNRHAFSFGEITAHAPTVSAVMRPANWIECTQQHPDDVPLIGIADPVIGSTLTKRGAGTRLSSFVVTNVGITHHYYTPQGFLNTVYGSIRVSSTQVAFAFEDIGSVAHTASGEVVGMIYDVAENRRVAWMTPIQPILDAFSATFYVQPDITETVLSNPNRGHTALASPPGLCTCTPCVRQTPLPHGCSRCLRAQTPRANSDRCHPRLGDWPSQPAAPSATAPRPHWFPPLRCMTCNCAPRPMARVGPQPTAPRLRPR